MWAAFRGAKTFVETAGAGKMPGQDFEFRAGRGRAKTGDAEKTGQLPNPLRIAPYLQNTGPFCLGHWITYTATYRRAPGMPKGKKGLIVSTPTPSGTQCRVQIPRQISVGKGPLLSLLPLEPSGRPQTSDPSSHPRAWRVLSCVIGVRRHVDEKSANAMTWENQQNARRLLLMPMLSGLGSDQMCVHQQG